MRNAVGKPEPYREQSARPFSPEGHPSHPSAGVHEHGHADVAILPEEGLCGQDIRGADERARAAHRDGSHHGSMGHAVVVTGGDHHLTAPRLTRLRRKIAVLFPCRRRRRRGVEDVAAHQ